VTVFLATPVIRTVARMELPSTRQRTTAVLLAVESVFILIIRLEEQGEISSAWTSKDVRQIPAISACCPLNLRSLYEM
jgi:hypothetical protein